MNTCGKEGVPGTKSHHTSHLEQTTCGMSKEPSFLNVFEGLFVVNCNILHEHFLFLSAVAKLLPLGLKFNFHKIASLFTSRLLIGNFVGNWLFDFSKMSTMANIFRELLIASMSADVFSAKSPKNYPFNLKQSVRVKIVSWKLFSYINLWRYISSAWLFSRRNRIYQKTSKKRKFPFEILHWIFFAESDTVKRSRNHIISKQFVYVDKDEMISLIHRSACP